MAARVTGALTLSAAFGVRSRIASGPGGVGSRDSEDQEALYL